MKCMGWGWGGGGVQCLNTCTFTRSDGRWCYFLRICICVKTLSCVINTAANKHRGKETSHVLVVRAICIVVGMGLFDG